MYGSVYMAVLYLMIMLAASRTELCKAADNTQSLSTCAPCTELCKAADNTQSIPTCAPCRQIVQDCTRSYKIDTIMKITIM